MSWGADFQKNMCFSACIQKWATERLSSFLQSSTTGQKHRWLMEHEGEVDFPQYGAFTCTELCISVAGFLSGKQSGSLAASPSFFLGQLSPWASSLNISITGVSLEWQHWPQVARCKNELCPLCHHYNLSPAKLQSLLAEVSKCRRAKTTVFHIVSSHQLSCQKSKESLPANHAGLHLFLLLILRLLLLPGNAGLLSLPSIAAWTSCRQSNGSIHLVPVKYREWAGPLC